MNANRITGILAVVIIFALGAASCGGGSAGTGATATALEIGGKVSVVDAEAPVVSQSLGVQSLAIGVQSLAIDPDLLPAGSDYNVDQTEVWVEERSVEAFSTINEILCMMKQTQYDDMVNKGAYTAMVDTAACDTSKDSASAAGQESENQSSGGNMPEYEYWTVISERADNSSPQFIKVWLHQAAKENEPAMTINVKVVITEGVSDDNPYGLFTMNFAAYPAAGGHGGNPVFTGLLKSELDPDTGKVILGFINEGSHPAGGGQTATFVQGVTLNRTGDGSEGTGRVFTADNNPNESSTEEFLIAYNSTNFLREDVNTSDTTCLDRKSFNESVWRYGLYDTEGARVTVNSGFPIKDESGNHGWIGYYGLWFPDDASLSNGDTVYRQEYGPTENTETPYEAFVSPGKLVKHERKNLALADIRNIPLDEQVWDEQSQTGTRYQTVWTGNHFERQAQMNESTWIWEPLNPAVVIDLTQTPYPDLNFWSKSLGGSVRVPLDSCTYDNNGTDYDWTDDFNSCSAGSSTAVILFSEEMVYPSDAVPANLLCLESCPDPANLDSNSPYLNNLDQQASAPDSQGTTYREYAYDSNTMSMTYGGEAVATTATNDNYQWGINSGPMFAATATNKAALACTTWNPTTGQEAAGTCGWNAWSALSVFYTWETGPNNWNRFTALQDPADGTFVEFDPPIMVTYTHSQSGNKYDGTTFQLDYSGFGDLQGIPGTCVDFDSGEVVGCGPDTRWVPEISISAGANVLASDGVTEYIVKPLEKEQRMKLDASVGACSTLSVVSYSLPTMGDWVDPAIGTEPVITEAPSVIAGVVQ